MQMHIQIDRADETPHECAHSALNFSNSTEITGPRKEAKRT
jgi:hypothetical protein